MRFDGLLNVSHFSIKTGGSGGPTRIRFSQVSLEGVDLSLQLTLGVGRLVGLDYAFRRKLVQVRLGLLQQTGGFFTIGRGFHLLNHRAHTADIRTISDASSNRLAYSFLS